MKKTTRSMLAVCSAVLTVFSVAACQSAKPVDEKLAIIEIEKADAANVFNASALSGEQFAKIEPGKVYVASNLADEITLTHPSNTEFNENGQLCARVYAHLAELSFFTWLVYPDYVDELAYRFIWFDNNGKIIQNAGKTQVRSTMPGDPVRFSEPAPNQNNKKFSIVIGYADSFDAEPDQKKAEKKNEKSVEKVAAKPAEKAAAKPAEKAAKK